MMGPERCCDLCLHRAKPVETLVEARSNSDVQIRLPDVSKGAKDSSNHLVAGSH